MYLKGKKRRLIYLLVAAVSVIGVWYFTQTGGSGYGDVTVQEAKMLIEDKPDLVILDIRTVAEYEDEHIEDAVNIPVDELENRLDEIDQTLELLVYCRTGNRSRRAINILEDNGFTKLFHMVGGIVEWKEAGYTTIS